MYLKQFRQEKISWIIFSFDHLNFVRQVEYSPLGNLKVVLRTARKTSIGQ